MQAFAIFNYLRAPVLLERDRQGIYNKLKRVWRIYCTYILLTLIIGLLLLALDNLLVKVFGVNPIIGNLASNSKKVNESFSPHVTILIIPFIEELAYRLGLSCRKDDFSFSTALMFYVTAGGTIVGLGLREGILACISFLIFLTLYRFTPETFLTRLRTSYFKYYFYFLALAFGLGHIGNFKPHYWELFYVYPFFAIPFIIMGIGISYIRVRCGFFYGLLLHAMFNATVALKYI